MGYINADPFLLIRFLQSITLRILHLLVLVPLYTLPEGLLQSIHHGCGIGAAEPIARWKSKCQQE